MPPAEPAKVFDRLTQALADRYTIEREVGRGGMALVYLAQDLKHHRQVAIKVLRPELSASLGSERFLREIEISAQLQHPMILPLYDSGEAEGLLYYVMPFIDGESLRDRIRSERQLPLDEAVGICRDAAEALDHAHEQGVVHRDVKPENILLTREHAIVADFGIARALSAAGGQALTDSGVAIGTPSYMSPEQASGDEEIDARTDIYALACVFQEMLTGEPPFTGTSPQVIIARQVSQEPPSVRIVRPTVSTTMESAIGKALAKIPADRFATALEFVEAMSRPAPLPTRKLRRSALLVAGIALIVAATLAGRDVWQRTRGTTAEPTSLNRIAVLYFDDGSADSSLGWLANGLTDELIDRLGEIEGLTVISQNGVRQFAGRQIATDSVGRILNVGLLVNGTVEPAGDSIRVSVRLIEPSTAVLMDRVAVTQARAEPLALRNEITERLQHALRRTIGTHIALNALRNETSNDDAWETMRRASEMAEDAELLALEGDFEAALVQVASADSLLALSETLDRDWLLPTTKRAELAWLRTRVTMGADPGSVQAFRPEAQALLRQGIAHATRALERDSTSVRALNVRGRLVTRLWGYADDPNKDTLLTSAFRDLSLATELDPMSATAWYTLAETEGYRQRTAQARVAAQRALEADIYAEEAPNVLALLLYDALESGDLPAARRYCDEGRRNFPEEENFLECELTLLAYSGQGDADVRRAWQLLGELDTVIALAHGRVHRRLYVAAVLARSGLRDSSLELVTRTRAGVTDERDFLPFLPVEAYVWELVGDRSRAVELLVTYFQAAPTEQSYWLSHHWFADLAAEEAFTRRGEP